MTLAERPDPPVLGTPADLHRTWQILVGGASDCAQVLIEVARNGRNDGHRVAAAKTVLEMSGFKSPDTVTVLPPDFDPAGAAAAGEGTSPAARLRSRLDALAASTPTDDDVVDAELVVRDEGIVEGVLVED